MRRCAVLCDRPTTLGTVALAAVVVAVVVVAVGVVVVPPVAGAPFETFKRTREPFRAFVPPCGLWATTNPGGGGEGTLKTAATSPASWMRLTASLRRRPTTFGTVTRCRPFETESATVEPFFTAVPAVGRCDTTRPGGAEAKITFWLDFSPAACKRFTATATVRPTTTGAASIGWPPEMVRPRVT